MRDPAEPVQTFRSNESNLNLVVCIFKIKGRTLYRPSQCRYWIFSISFWLQWWPCLAPSNLCTYIYLQSYFGQLLGEAYSEESIFPMIPFSSRHSAETASRTQHLDVQSLYPKSWGPRLKCSTGKWNFWNRLTSGNLKSIRQLHS